MFIVARPGIRLRKGFYIWTGLLMLLLGLGGLLTMHIHYDPDPRRED